MTGGTVEDLDKFFVADLVIHKQKIVQNRRNASLFLFCSTGIAAAVNRKHRDVLIVGQGLAGSALAMALRKKGASVCVADASNLCSASEVAAGLITTLAGKGMNPGWRQEEYLPVSLAYFCELESRYAVKIFYPLPVLRPFVSEGEKLHFEKNKSKRDPWLIENEPIPSSVKASCGAFTMRGGGRIDTRCYLNLVRNLLGNDFVDAEVLEDELILHSDAVVWRGNRYARVIFCNGFRGLAGRFFSHLPSRSAKGEMLTIRLDALPEDRILSKNGWLVPIGGKRWRAGASYSWEQLDSIPTESGREDVLARIKANYGGSFEVIEQSAGVRPIVNNSQPVIGLHPEFPRVGIFNGLGSKGVITAYPVALHFAEVLLEGKELDPELNFQRLLKLKLK
jgi:glycine oxidase